MSALVAATLTIPGTSFEIPTNVVILGTITGLTYALMAVGITLIYRTSRVLNFATGEMGALPAVLIPILVINNSWPYWLALALALLGSVVLSAGTEALVIRPLSRGPRLTMLVATIGLAQVFFGLNLLIPRGGELTGKPFPVPFDWRLTVGSLVLGPGQLLIIFVAPVCILALTWYLNRSPLGKASRAAAENAEAAQLAGVPIGRVSLNIWAIAGLLAGIGAILAGGTRPLTLSAALGPALLLRALGASMIGGLRSIWGSFAGGIGIGIVEALIIWNYPVGGVLEVVLASLILVSMLVRPGLGKTPRGSTDAGWSLTATIRPLVPSIAGETRVRLAKWATLLGLVVDRRPRSARRATQQPGGAHQHRADGDDVHVAGRAHRLRRSRLARPVRVRRHRCRRRRAAVPARAAAPAGGGPGHAARGRARRRGGAARAAHCAGCSSPWPRSAWRWRRAVGSSTRSGSCTPTTRPGRRCRSHDPSSWASTSTRSAPTTGSASPSCSPPRGWCTGSG